MSASVQSYNVKGMTCHSCVAMVSEEVGEVDGVESVDVDLDSGMVTVKGAGVDDDAVRSAIVEAGFQTA